MHLNNYQFFMCLSLVQNWKLVDVGHAIISTEISGLILLKLKSEKEADFSKRNATC